MKIDRCLNEYNSYDIDIVDNDKILRVQQVGSDLTISCFKETFEKIDNMTFNISKEDDELYRIFDKLYYNIIHTDFNGVSYIYNMIVDDNKIKIASDNYPLVCPNILNIKREEDNIELVFEKINGKKINGNMYGEYKMPYDIPIHIRMSGSRLGDFSSYFKVLFNDLQDINLVRKYVRKR